MQVKKHRDSDRGGGNMLEGDGLRKNSSCFSNIKIFLISECALMLAQGTVGAYLVSATHGRQESDLRPAEVTVTLVFTVLLLNETQTQKCQVQPVGHISCCCLL